MIKDIISNKTVKEKVQIKSQEIAKLNHVGKFKDKDLDVEILSLQAIQVGEQHGVELMARAWKDGKQIGFGSDGSVEIERFRIFNPPILVEDPNGTIEQKHTSPEGEVRVRKFKEDPKKAIQQVITHNISLVGKGGEKIIKGKIGNTTSTFYPAAGLNSPVDGGGRVIEDTSWANLRDNVGTSFDDEAETSIWSGFQDSTTNNQWVQIYRLITLFDTSTISTDDISSATWSIYAISKSTNAGGGNNHNVYSATTAANNDIVNGDITLTSFGSTTFSTGITTTNITTSAYNDYAFNASGLAAINKTGISKFGFLMEADVTGSAPTNNNNGVADFDRVECSAADTAGTAQDPKLVVVHGAATTTDGNFFMFMDRR